ncbi:MAG TPA: TetR/AcrR family transcriptional regulator [Thermoanaerobaculia bacterium]|nr:TetR/AcrR family transcriptional regulator [Thermoanaerobaculia bacterium]
MTRSATRRSRRRAIPADSPRDRLLVAATALFTSRGYAGTSVREIVEHAGVTKPVLYYYFGNKEGIYRALVAQLLSEFEARLAEGQEHRGSLRDRVTAVCVDLFRLVEQRLDAVRFLYGVYYGPPQSAPPFDLDIFPRRFRATLEKAVREGIAAGELRRLRAEDVITAIEAMLNIGVEAALTEPERHFSNKDLTRLIDLLFTGAAATPTS